MDPFTKWSWLIMNSSKIALTMDSFAKWSGLTMNSSKTQLFSVGQNQQEALDLHRFGFSTSSLPIRYLGLPLMHQKLRWSDYSPLIESLSSKFSSWTIHALSYAGRLQLLTSVIYSLLNFWMSAFFLPKSCIKKIQSMCSRFLWSGDITKKGLAKVSWSDIFRPKMEGELGLRNLSLWIKLFSYGMLVALCGIWIVVGCLDKEFWE